MEWLNKTVGVIKQVVEAAVAVLALAIVLQVLFGPNTPFFPVDVVGNVIDLTKALGGQGLVGLVAAGVLLTIFTKK
mgnify:CR=1 FL=1